MIFKVYTWVVFKLFQRKDMWTPQFARMVIAHGGFFWLVYLSLQTWLFWHLFTGQLWQQILSALVVVLSSWFIDHIIDHIRQHPENLPNR